MKAFIGGLALLTVCCTSQSAEILSKMSQVCAKPLTGVIYKLSTDLDATSGKATDRWGSVFIMIGGHPDIPPTMKIKPSTTNIVPNLSDDLTFLSESADKNGHGKVSLYGFNLQTVKTGRGTAQYQSLVMLSAKDGKGNFSLLKRIGNALYRCR